MIVDTYRQTVAPAQAGAQVRTCVTAKNPMLCLTYKDAKASGFETKKALR